MSVEPAAVASPRRSNLRFKTILIQGDPIWR
jgi:hypothetical protein